ncbi:MAG: hypothetical protein KR126chlam2_00671 [Chlamydiae bacterium]|nr:hypothetical protein [Chlamydiota bacterium]
MANPQNPIDPLKTPETTRPSPTPEYGAGKPAVGAGEEAQEPKPFSLPPEAGKTAGQVAGTEAAGQPSPMAAAQEAEKPIPWTPEEMNNNIVQAQQTLTDAKSQLQDPTKAQGLTDVHNQALGKVVDTMNPDMQTIANTTGQEYAPAKQGEGEGILSYVTKWIDGAQGTMSGALNYLSTMKNPNPADFMKLQYAMQRASQRGEVFASIISSSVSGVKSIMSIQLG